MILYKIGWIMSASIFCINILAVHNFEILNGNPKIPIYVQANGGPWQLLGHKQYRYPINVPENNLLIMILSANENKTEPVSLIFAPEKALAVAQQVGSKITKAPTFYVTANVVTGTDKTTKHVQLTPQATEGASNKTKFGLSLDNNVNQEIIDAIVEIASAEAPVIPADKDAPIALTTTKESVEERNIGTPIQKDVQQQIKEPEEPVRQSITHVRQAPMTQKHPLQHQDTPQKILRTLQDIIEQYKTDANEQWNQMRYYLTQHAPTDHFKSKDENSIYTQLKNYYQEKTKQTKIV